ncbi:MAG: hypothetical protein VX938_04640, partial [Myxococcota bacterium]|nr:hypothetical protein [Myxococcota bacterium]
QSGLCVFVPSGNCMLLGCNSHQITDPVALEDPGTLDPEGTPVKLEVTAGPGELSECTGLVCEDDAPCCNSCNATVGLLVEETPLPLTLDPSWGCATDDCMESATCSPVMAGVGYWVWGHVYPPEDETAPPVFEVDDWCIQTTPDGLSGVYRGLLEPWGGADVQEVEVVVTWDDGWKIALSASPLEGGDSMYDWVYGDIPDQEVTNITVGEADVSFEFNFCEVWEGEAGAPCDGQWNFRTVTARLTSQESSLVGDVTSFGGTGWNPAEDGPSPEDPGPGGGEMEAPMISVMEGPIQLERIPPQEVASQADSTSTP